MPFAQIATRIGGASTRDLGRHAADRAGCCNEAQPAQGY
ncbi:MAG: hypothetical protein ACR5K7_05165 [Symbiopectobacterium sp.]